MTHMPREPEAFGEQVMRILQRHFHDSSIELTGPLDIVLDGRHLGLENLYRMVQCDQGRGVELVEDFLERLVEGDSLGQFPMPLQVARGRIMPRIQPSSIFDQLDREQVAHAPFVNDTVIVYVIDMPRMTVSITVEQMIRWGLGIDDLDRIARGNLARYDQNLLVRMIESKDGGRAAIMALQDGYDAARLLLSSLHSRLAPELHGNFYVAAPARDMFIAFSREPTDFVERLRRRIVFDYRRLPYPISEHFFLVTRDGVAGTQLAA